MQTLRLYLFWKVPDVFLLDTILLDSLALNLQSILQKHDWNLKIKVEEVKVQSGQCSGIYNLVAKRKKKQYMSFCFSQNNNLCTQFKVHIINYFLLNFLSFILIIRGYAFISPDAESPLTFPSDLNAAVIRLNSDALAFLSFA